MEYSELDYYGLAKIRSSVFGAAIQLAIQLAAQKLPRSNTLCSTCEDVCRSCGNTQAPLHHVVLRSNSGLTQDDSPLPQVKAAAPQSCWRSLLVSMLIAHFLLFSNLHFDYFLRVIRLLGRKGILNSTTYPFGWWI